MQNFVSTRSWQIRHSSGSSVRGRREKGGVSSARVCSAEHAIAIRDQLQGVPRGRRISVGRRVALVVKTRADTSFAAAAAAE